MTARPKGINVPERMRGAIATVEPYGRRDHSELEPFGDSVNVAARLSVWAPNRKGTRTTAKPAFASHQALPNSLVAISHQFRRRAGPPGTMDSGRIRLISPVAVGESPST